MNETFGNKNISDMEKQNIHNITYKQCIHPLVTQHSNTNLWTCDSYGKHTSKGELHKHTYGHNSTHPSTASHPLRYNCLTLPYSVNVSLFVRNSQIHQELWIHQLHDTHPLALPYPPAQVFNVLSSPRSRSPQA